MTVQLHGSQTLGQAVPLAATAAATATVALTQAMAPLQARVTGLLSLQVSLALTPPSFADAIAKAQALIQALIAAAALPLPSVDVQAAGVAALLLELGAQLAALEASLSLVAEMPLSTPGIYAYSMSGPIAPTANELSSLLSGGLPEQDDPQQPVVGVLLLAAGANVAATAALKAAFGV